MLIETKQFKQVCSKILAALDTKGVATTINETLELKVEENNLLLNVTNREYFVTAKFPLDQTERFHATVKAQLFLKLMPQITSEMLELTVKDNYLFIKANGNYKLPLIFEKDNLLSLPKITIDNITCNMNISNDILQSILKYNSKELLSSGRNHPVQDLYYLDQEGCITFTAGACVNNFNLEKPLKILLTDKIVRLFKLFKDDNIAFSLGHDALTADFIQTKVNFKSSDIELTAILNCDNSLLNKVPVGPIRNRANATHNYSAVVNRESLMSAISRLTVFNNLDKEKSCVYRFNFKSDIILIADIDNGNEESIHTTNQVNCEDYSSYINLKDLKNVLSSCEEEFLTFMFGNNTALNIVRGNIINVVPELSMEG